uniref:Glutathione peroxidase n=1 Tax=Rhipicephalus appendiculatus TaxID=34631 RepID=A0A131Z3D1_RHIAP
MPRLPVRARRRRKMLSRLVLALMCAAAGAAGAAPRKADCDGRPLSPELYRFQIPDVLGTRNISLDQYRGHVLLVVNVATY